MKEQLDQQTFLEQSTSHLQEMLSSLDHLGSLSLAELPRESTLVAVVDLNRGFAKQGALYSPRTEELLPGAAAFVDRCIAGRYSILPYTDCHTADSPELASYPPHCLMGTEEPLLALELSRLEAMARPKNSTNAYLADPELFQAPQVTHVVILGCCTDICIYQLAVTLTAYYNQHNRKVEVIVPVNLVDTYDGPGHPADLCNLMALYSMRQNGVTLVRTID